MQVEWGLRFFCTLYFSLVTEEKANKHSANALLFQHTYIHNMTCTIIVQKYDWYSAFSLFRASPSLLKSYIIPCDRTLFFTFECFLLLLTFGPCLIALQTTFALHFYSVCVCARYGFFFVDVKAFVGCLSFLIFFFSRAGGRAFVKQLKVALTSFHMSNCVCTDNDTNGECKSLTAIHHLFFFFFCYSLQFRIFMRFILNCNNTVHVV